MEHVHAHVRTHMHICAWSEPRALTPDAACEPDGEWLFPRYIKDGKCYATHASNAVNKWLKRDFGGLLPIASDTP